MLCAAREVPGALEEFRAVCAYNRSGLTNTAIWLEHRAWGIMATESAAFSPAIPKSSPTA
jgi:hypothetical protein